jgi:hypothetical protein
MELTNYLDGFYCMQIRRAGGNVLAGLVLIILGVVVGLLVYSWNIVIAPGDGPSYHVVIDSVTFSEPVSVANARWEISLMVRNDGKGDVTLRKLYISRKLVDEYGLAPGDSLSSKSVIGTSLPVEGLVIEADSRSYISIWIGSELYSSGNQISIHIFDPNNLEYTRYIKLK